MNNQNDKTLQELKNSDYRLADGQPDVEGWSICNSNHEEIGTVHDLLFDPGTRKVRYLIADLSDGVDDESGSLVLIPIGMAELHATNNEVLLPTVSEGQLGQFSPYPFDVLKNNVSVGDTVPASAAGFDYDHEKFNEERFYRNRPSAVAGRKDDESIGARIAQRIGRNAGGSSL